MSKNIVYKITCENLNNNSYYGKTFFFTSYTKYEIGMCDSFNSCPEIPTIEYKVLSCEVIPCD